VLDLSEASKLSLKLLVKIVIPNKYDVIEEIIEEKCKTFSPNFSETIIELLISKFKPLRDLMVSLLKDWNKYVNFEYIQKFMDQLQNSET